MQQYLLRRLLLVLPTLWAIITINFIIIQFVPGGPVEQAIAMMTMPGIQNTDRIQSSGDNLYNEHSSSHQEVHHSGLSTDTIQKLNKLYGFDKPVLERYFNMIVRYLCFDFGYSYYRNETVLNIIAEKLPVSMSLGFFSTSLLYLIALPLGIYKARHHKSTADRISSILLLFGNAIPTFLFAILMIVLFAGGDFFRIFPLRGLSSSYYESLSTIGRIMDYLWHLVLPVSAILIGSITALTFLVKHSFLEEIPKPYVTCARAKGLTERSILYNHIFRNALLIVIAGIPAAVVDMFFTGSLLIEIIFSLDGLGLLGYEATLTHDYPIVFGSLYIFTLLSLMVNIITDLCYCLVDKRISFEALS